MSLSTRKDGKRKRTREVNQDFRSKQIIFDDNKQINDSELSSTVGPLNGVIACLSGFAQERKEDLHDIILSLGGR